MFNPLTDIEHYTALTCLANPSGDTSGTQYSVTVVISDNGEPIGASCNCVAEKCEVLTDKLCRWIVRKGPKAGPKPIYKVSVKNMQ